MTTREAFSSSLRFLICSFVLRIRDAAKTHKLVEQELAHAVNATALVLTEAKLSSPEVRHRSGEDERAAQTDGQMASLTVEAEKSSCSDFQQYAGFHVSSLAADLASCSNLRNPLFFLVAINGSRSLSDTVSLAG